MSAADSPPPDADSVMRRRGFLGLLALAAIVGVVASAAAWGFLELVHELEDWVYDDLPDALGYDAAPTWWPLPVLALAGVAVAFAIARLPDGGGHRPLRGIDPEPTQPVALPGVLVAATATVGLGPVLGPEAPLIALGGGLGFLAMKLVRSGAGEDASTLVAVSGTFAAISFLFGSPVIAALFLIEATGLGGSRLRLVLIPGLLAAGIGSLVSIGMGSWTGVDTSDIALEPVDLPAFDRPDAVDFLWTVPFAAAIAVVAFGVFALARPVERLVVPRPFVGVPAAGLAVAALAIAFVETTDKGFDQVLFSGEAALGSLASGAGGWSLSALALLVAFKGFAYALSLAAFRGGPVFPALFLGAAGGLMVAGLPGYELTPAVAVGMGAATAAVLRLPLSAVVLATLLTFNAGLGVGPLIIVGVVVAHLVTVELSRRWGPASDAPAQ